MHPFYSPVKGWTLAGDLRAGDILVTVNGEYRIVEWVQHEILEQAVKVYNFQVEGNHMYYVSATYVLVHNACDYRTKAKEYYGTDTVGQDAHHIFPQEFRSYFSERGINIYVPENIIFLEKHIHRKASKIYNALWSEFITSHPDASCETIKTPVSYL